MARDRNAGATATVDGLDAMLKALELLDENARQGFRDAAMEAGQITLAAAYREAPRKTGALGQSIKLVSTTRGVKIRAGGTVRVPYANAVHFGYHRSRLDTRYRFARKDIKANPFLFRAVDQTASQVAERYLESINTIWETAIHG